MDWTSWQALQTGTRYTEEGLKELLDGGQAFRWNFLDSEQAWQGTWGIHCAQLRLHAQGTLRWRAPHSDGLTAETELKRYLGCDTDWETLADALPWRSDPPLKTAIDAFPGLRLLDQPFPETLLCFMCSATKQIPQIKLLCENLAAALGEPLFPNGPHALPTWERIATASETELRSLSLGFRAKNIKKTADLIAASPDCLKEIESLPYADAKQRLLEFPGVGSKIADCALLFGARKFEAFPVDTWILKVLETRYGLKGWNASQLEQFGRIHLGKYAGYAQQFLFAYERMAARKSER